MLSKKEKRKDAFFIFYESVMKPDHELRQDAHEQGCYNELLEWRDEGLIYLDKRRKELDDGLIDDMRQQYRKIPKRY